MLIGRVTAIILTVALTAPLAEAQEQSSLVPVNGTSILAADVDAKLGISLSKLQDQIYALRQKQIDAMIDQQLLEDEAARRKVTISSLVQSEINILPQARAAGEAALCANGQGMFREFHDKVFANSPEGSPAMLGRFAKEIGLDADAFEACRTSGKHKAAIQPLDGFLRVIDEELALAAKGGTR